MSRRTVRRPLLATNQNQGRLARRHKPDYILIMLSTALLVVGLIIVYAISPGLSNQRNVGENYFVSKQIMAIGIGVIAFLITSLIPYTKWRLFLRPAIVLATVATIVALITPYSPEYPAHRWIRVGGFSLQSVEVVKLAVILGMSVFLEKRIQYGETSDIKKSLKPIIIALIAIGAVVSILQRDLGSMAVIVAIMATMAFVAGLPLLRLAQISMVIALVLMVLILPFDYRRDRIATFLNPERDCQNEGYQACQALIAVGSGGLFGIGLQKSGQAYGYLPEAASDSIFAITAERFGFLGSALLICLFMVFFARLKFIVERAPDDFSRLIVVGLLAWLSTQTIINIGAMIGLLPLKGITLPFISYGGTSVVFVMIAVGMAFNISRYTSFAVNRNTGSVSSRGLERRINENSSDWRRNRRSYYTDISRSA